MAAGNLYHEVVEVAAKSLRQTGGFTGSSHQSVADLFSKMRNGVTNFADYARARRLLGFSSILRHYGQNIKFSYELKFFLRVITASAVVDIFDGQLVPRK